MVFRQMLMVSRDFSVIFIAGLASCAISPLPQSGLEDDAALDNTEEMDGKSEEDRDSDSLQTDQTDADVPEDSSTDKPQGNEIVNQISSDASIAHTATDTFSAEETDRIPASESFPAGIDGSIPINNLPEEQELPEGFEWAKDLVEDQYAVRIDSYRNDMYALIAPLTEVLLADFYWNGQSVILSLQVCSWTAEWKAGGLNEDCKLLDPLSIPKVEREVTYKGEHWETEPTPYYIGFQPEPLVPCNPGERVRADSSQVWLSDGMCTCYDNTSIPNRPDDCRIVDTDNDGNPGISFEVIGDIDNVLYYTWNRSYHYINGTIDSEGNHTANKSADSEIEVFLSCENTSPMACVRYSSVHCRPEVNSVRFTRLPPTTPAGNEWSCREVRNSIETLLPPPSSRIPTNDC